MCGPPGWLLILGAMKTDSSSPRQSLSSQHRALRRMDVGEMLRTDPPPVRWLIETLLVLGSLCMLGGREGEGKSLTAMTAAVAVAIGGTLAGMRCERGRVLIVDAENGKHEIHRRMHGLGLTPQSADSLFVYEAQGWDLRRDLADLERLIEQHQPSLVVLDSFRSLWPGGDENDSAAVAQVLDPLRNLLRGHDAAGLLLHHLAKHGGYRGSTGIGAACELVFTLESVEGDPDRDRRRLHCSKLRAAAKPDDKWLRITATPDGVSLQADTAYVPDLAPRAPAKEQLRPLILAAIQARPGSRLHEIATEAGRNPKDASVRNVLNDLVAEGQIYRHGPEYHAAAGIEEKVQCKPPVRGLCTLHLSSAARIASSPIPSACHSSPIRSTRRPIRSPTCHGISTRPAEQEIASRLRARQRKPAVTSSPATKTEVPGAATSKAGPLEDSSERRVVPTGTVGGRASRDSRRVAQLRRTA